MTKTISDFRTAIRQITQDPAGSVSPHHTDAELDQFTVDAFRRLFALRPDTRYDASGRLADIVFPTDANQLAAFSVTFDERWNLGIVYAAASRAFETDVTDSVNRELSISYLQKADAEFQR